MGISVESRMLLGDSLLDQGITELAFIEANGGLVLVASSGRNGGLSSYQIDATGSARFVDWVLFDPDWSATISDAFALVEGAGNAVDVVFGSTEPGELNSYSMASDGQFLGLVGYQGLSPASDRPYALASTTDGLVWMGQHGAASFLSRTESGVISETVALSDTDASHTSYVTTATSTVISGTEYLFVGDVEEDGVTAFALTGSTPIVTGVAGPGQGVGIMDPVAIETATVLGETYVIVGSQQGANGALSVFRVEPDGSLAKTDHVTDNQVTRFGGLQDLAVASVDGRVFVTAAGNDGGMSLFVLLPGGQLQHLETKVNGYVGQAGQAALAEVTALSAAAIGNTIHIAVSSQEVGGFTHLSFDVSGHGVERMASVGGDMLSGGSNNDLIVGGPSSDTLLGNAGDDIIVDGKGSDILFGGSGADVFVLRDDVNEDLIMDFDKSEDRLDLSSLPFFYDPAALTITTIANGAIVTWRGSQLVIRSSDGSAISEDDLRAAVLQTPDRAMDLSGYDFPDDPGDDYWDIGDLGLGFPYNTTDGGPVYDFDDVDGNQRITGTWRADRIRIAGGNDTIFAGDGNDTVHGGIGINRVYLEGGSDTFDDLGTSTPDDGDFIWGGTGNDTIISGQGADTIDGGNDSDEIRSGSGNDIVTGGYGSDIAWLGNGHDRYEDSDDEGRGGSDAVRGGFGNDDINGGGGNDFLFGEAGDDKISGRDGDDQLDGGDGDDTIWGAAGADLISGGNHADKLYGGGGDDDLKGGSGSDLLQGGTNNDRLDGGFGADILRGEAGDDYVDGGSGLDELFGDDGDDTLFGGDDNDKLRGGAHNDTLYGGANRDKLFGQGDDDVLFGGQGGDRLAGNKGDDRLFGDGGRDKLLGGGGNDKLKGGVGNDLLKGQAGRDKLIGESGKDKLFGAGGNDRLVGNKGNDTLIGGAGKDTLLGGPGKDKLRGGADADSFIFKGNVGHDRVLDFEEQDRIILKGVVKAKVDVTVIDGDTHIDWLKHHVILNDVSAAEFSFDDLIFR